MIARGDLRVLLGSLFADVRNPGVIVMLHKGNYILDAVEVLGDILS